MKMALPMTCLTQAYAKTGQRCYGRQERRTKEQTNVIEALVGKTLLTTTLFITNINTEVSRAWLNLDLLPKLQRNSVNVMDNTILSQK